ncbi:hypothetical protein ACFV9C_01810 [Kribbella sp. NPDC059898]|uniref:hypothetical protein n=1 Tax=Kribbella sp. NPDC059898 TaxID=3346995 RepID=UPI00365B67E5
MRRLLAGIGFTIVLFCTILTPTSAEATTVVRSYDLEYTGTSTYTRGHVYFYNRSVEVAGEQNSSNTTGQGCRYTKAITNLGAYKYTSVVCGGTTENYDLIIPADVVGGAASVKLEFYSTDDTRTTLLGWKTISRR